MIGKTKAAVVVDDSGDVAAAGGGGGAGENSTVMGAMAGCDDCDGEDMGF
jgi:hypothetical protein